MKVVVITGSRDWTDAAPIKASLRGANALIVGDCPPRQSTRASADALALVLARKQNIAVKVFAASRARAEYLRSRGVHVELVSDWQLDGSRAGPLRNRAIVNAATGARDAGSEVSCHAFPLPGSSGTHDCIRQLRTAGFDVDVHHARAARRAPPSPQLATPTQQPPTVPNRALMLFWGHERAPGAPSDHVGRECLSQWYAATFTADGQQFRSAEQYMMYRKALLFGDSATAAEILRSDTPRRAKDLGRTVRGFEELTWREHRARIVVEGNLAKFNQNDRLRQYLLGTRDALLAEASPYDRLWGIGLAATDPRARDPARWRGENQLGTSLMEVRTQLKREFSAPPPELARGDLLHAATEALVNPVNTRGVMGKGLALQFKRAYPANFAAYARACARNELQPGGIFVTEQEAMPRVIMNVATKAHWRDPSQLRYVQDGLNNIVSRTRALQVRSIAIPALGCGEGGLRWTEVKPLLERAAAQISNVRVVLFEPQRALEAEQRRGLPNKGIDLDR